MLRHSGNLFRRKATGWAAGGAEPGLPPARRTSAIVAGRGRVGWRSDRPCCPVRLFDTAAAISLALVIGCGAAVAAAEDKVWTRSEILAIADAEAKRLGYDVEHMSVAFDLYNTQWEQFEMQSVQNTPPPMVQALTGRDFFAVYYGPMQAQSGGDLWVFVDRHTGEIVTTIRGK